MRKVGPLEELTVLLSGTSVGFATSLDTSSTNFCSAMFKALLDGEFRFSRPSGASEGISSAWLVNRAFGGGNSALAGRSGRPVGQEGFEILEKFSGNGMLFGCC